MSPKDNFIKSLELSGWHILPESIDEFIQDNPKINLQSLTKQLLDSDLKNIGSKHLQDGILGGKTEKFEANCVLQLIKIRNIGAPKENEHSHSSPCFYKITLTDGSTNINCLAMENISNLNLNTPPGTKIYMTGEIKIKSNMLLLFAKNVKILGGHVDYLVEKWKLTKDLSSHVRKMCMTDTPPPPWVPFGTHQKTQVDTSKKVFEETEKKDEDSNEFSEARKAIVAEALEAKSKTIKTFVQQNIDKNKIISETKLEVKTSLVQPDKSKEPKKGRKGKFRDIDNEQDYSDKNNTARPPASATLFDALKTKLNLDDEPKSEPPVEEIRETRGFRAQRNQRGRRPQQMINKPLENKQTYNPNDFNFELGEDPKKSSIKDDFYYNPADFEEKPNQAPKTEFKNSFDTSSSNQYQNRNSANLNKNFKSTNNYQFGQYEPNVPAMTFGRSQRNQQNYNNRYQNYDHQSSYQYDNRAIDYGYYYDDNFNSQYQYDQESRQQRGNNNFRQNNGNFNRNQNFNRRNY